MSSKNITPVTKENVEAEVLKSDKLVLIDFYADWCGPCKALAPKLEQIADENLATLKVVKIDVDASPELAAKYGIRAMPTLVLVKDGQIVASSVGNKPKSEIEALINKFLQAPPAGKKPGNKGPTP